MKVDKGPEMAMPEGQVDRNQIDVVTYDEEQQRIPEVQAVAVEEESNSQRPQHRNYESNTTTTAHPSSQQQHENTGSFDCLLCGDTTLRRITSGTNVSVSLCGHTFIDVRDSSFASGAKLNVWLIRLLGNVHVLVRPGTRVVVRRLLLCGNRDVHIEDDEQQSNEQEASHAPPRVTLTIISLCGNVRIRSDPDDI